MTVGDELEGMPEYFSFSSFLSAEFFLVSMTVHIRTWTRQAVGGFFK